MSNILDAKNWTGWKPFPNPEKQEYIFAPIGYGVYQLYDIHKKEYILFGCSKNLAYRMASLLPKSLGQGGRNSAKKREYVWENITNIQYRTIPFKCEADMKSFEKKLKELNCHKFNT